MWCYWLPARSGLVVKISMDPDWNNNRDGDPPSTNQESSVDPVWGKHNLFLLYPLTPWASSNEFQTWFIPQWYKRTWYYLIGERVQHDYFVALSRARLFHWCVESTGPFFLCLPFITRILKGLRVIDPLVFSPFAIILSHLANKMLSFNINTVALDYILKEYNLDDISSLFFSIITRNDTE